MANYPCAFKCVVPKLLTDVHSHQALVSWLAYRQPAQRRIHSPLNVNGGQSLEMIPVLSPCLSEASEWEVDTTPFSEVGFQQVEFDPWAERGKLQCC